jgi:mono/diheme cytochrome c family protein
MKKFLTAILVLAVIGLAVFWFITSPKTIGAEALAAGYTPDLKNGEEMFNAAGCAGCHTTAGQKERLRLGGGMAFHTQFGTFHAPNISPDNANGIGAWSELQFVNAVQRGVGIHGEHLYPALPYTSYQRMHVKDVRDLFAYIKTLPADATANKPHEIGFPFNIRRLLGGWKFLYMDNKEYADDAAHDAQWNRGGYLVEGPGHCAECHSPRDPMGGILKDSRFAGGKNPDGPGWVPNITPHADGIKWSKEDMASFLETGQTPEFDSAGGSMAEVIENMSRLTAEDREAMAAYLVTLPPRPGKKPADAPKK